MKKLIFTFAMAALLMGATACHKDDPDENASSGEGVYNPEMRIASVEDDDGGVETWEWGSSKLASITSDDAVTSFDYNGGRMSLIQTTQGNNTTQMEYTYDNGWMSKMALISDNKNLVTANIRHNADDKISGMSVTLNEDYLLDLFTTYLLPNLMSKDQGRKLSLSNQDIQAAYVWDGNNVKQIIFSANLSAKIKMSDFTDIIGSDLLESMLGDYAYLLNLLGEAEMPLSLGVRDTLSYTYDNQKNPYYMMLADGPMAKALSANNILIEKNSGMVDIDLTLSIPLLGDLPINQSIPVQFDNSWEYSYNDKGFPIAIIDNHGKSNDIHYN